jgi:hypothetical protein
MPSFPISPNSSVTIIVPIDDPEIMQLNNITADHDEGRNSSRTISEKSAVFWDMAPRRCIINRRFGGTRRHHLQVRRNNASEQKC